MKKILFSIERPENRSTGVITWNEGGQTRSGRFDRNWTDEQAVKYYEVTNAPEKGVGKGKCNE